MARDYYSSMIFLKCILAGLGFLVGSAILLPLVAIALLMVFVGPGIGIDLGSTVRSSPILWVLAFLLFLLGFFWEYRRARSRRAG